MVVRSKQDADVFPAKRTRNNHRGGLIIRVEEKPNTPMQCARKEYWDCYVYPNTPR